MAKVGDKVRITGRLNDPHPPEIGLEGEVEQVLNAGKPYEQISVKWDNGSSLMLLPEDRGCYRVVA